MTAAEEFREASNWFAQWKRDNPLSFWVAVLLPWVFAAFTIGVPAILVSAFPFYDAKQALTLPAKVGAKTFKVTCKLPSGAYIFGYDLYVENTEKNKIEYFGRVCRDVVNGGWALSVN